MGRRSRETTRMRDGYLRGALSREATPRQREVLAAFVAAGGSVQGAAERAGIRPSTAKRHLADLRAKSGLSTEQLIYAGAVAGWLVVPSLESPLSDATRSHVQPHVLALLDFQTKDPLNGPDLGSLSLGEADLGGPRRLRVSSGTWCRSRDSNPDALLGSGVRRGPGRPPTSADRWHERESGLPASLVATSVRPC